LFSESVVPHSDLFSHILNVTVMNNKQFALGGFNRVNGDALLVRAMTVLQAMDNNAAFPDPVPALADVTPLMEDFSDKLKLARRKGSPLDTAVKNLSRKALAAALKELAFYVSAKADGALHALLSSGFELSSYPRGGEVPEIIAGVKLQDGKQSGQMRLDFIKQPSALLYEYRYAHEQDEAGLWNWAAVLRTSTSRNNILAPLVLYKRYYVEVRAINGFGASAWSEAVSHVVR
jgi:hypothetical protein